MIFTIGTLLLMLQTPTTHEKTGLENIRAFLQITERLATSGQIDYDQIETIRDAGYEVVVNLAPARKERNGEEGFRITEEGMTYVQIPVSWEEPSLRDLRLFFDVLEANQDRKVYVHCFANMRVSVFVYLYRTLRLGESDEKARVDLAKIWDPASEKQWESFIEDARSKMRPNE
jgi:protein tyrosine phosphatase (PTP) superfamily phosphohydrolase (DUF442 family)